MASTPQTFVIEKGIPLPPVGRAAEGNLRTTLRRMEVGDSFFLPGPRSGRGSGQKWTTIYCFPNRKHSARKATENGVAGHRIWRTV